MGKRSLGPGESPEVRLKYVHMLKEDYATWTAFLESGVLKLEEVWYDVHVGVAMEVPSGAPMWMLRVADGVSRKRIDVLGRMGVVYSVIEVKPIANMEAIGQVVTYRRLFGEEFEVPGVVGAVVVCMTVDRDVVESARELDVVVMALEGVGL